PPPRTYPYSTLDLSPPRFNRHRPGRHGFRAAYARDGLNLQPARASATYALDRDDEARCRRIAAAVDGGALDGRSADSEDAAGLRSASGGHRAVLRIRGAHGVADLRPSRLSRLHGHWHGAGDLRRSRIEGEAGDAQRPRPRDVAGSNSAPCLGVAIDQHAAAGGTCIQAAAA